MLTPLRDLDKREKYISKGVRIDITHIPPQGFTKTLECSAEELSLDLEDIKFTNSIRIIAQLKRVMNFIHLKGEVIVKLKLKCSRCLEDFKKNFSYNLNREFSLRGDEVFIDITEALREEIILNHPFKILCSYDCKGLCPVCGINLNKGKCDCKFKIQNAKSKTTNQNSKSS